MRKNYFAKLVKYIVFPEVLITNEKLKINYPVDNILKMKFLRYNEYKIDLITSGDGYTKSFQIPYF